MLSVMAGDKAELPGALRGATPSAKSCRPLLRWRWHLSARGKSWSSLEAVWETAESTVDGERGSWIARWPGPSFQAEKLSPGLGWALRGIITSPAPRGRGERCHIPASSLAWRLLPSNESFCHLPHHVSTVVMAPGLV